MDVATVNMMVATGFGELDGAALERWWYVSTCLAARATEPEPATDEFRLQRSVARVASALIPPWPNR